MATTLKPGKRKLTDLNQNIYNLFCKNTDVYGSCFYKTTGFHGFHVYIETTCSFVSVILNHSTNKHHFEFESAI